MNIRVLRDMKARQGVNANEILRRAYLYVARNQTLPPQVRYQAQLQLNTFNKYTRPTTVKNRCHESGKGRGVLSEFALTRVSASTRIMGGERVTLMCGGWRSVSVPAQGTGGGASRSTKSVVVEIKCARVSIITCLVDPLTQLTSVASGLLWDM